ncbi:MAG: hypothetical protein Q4G59_01805 [Planctomycetia bacterium]|nr:hypothetical protein [Planctomycetia bacterium]
MSKKVLLCVVSLIAIVAMSDALFAQTRVVSDAVSNQAAVVAPGTLVTSTTATNTPAVSVPAPAVKPVAPATSATRTNNANYNANSVNRAYHPRVGLGFNGIPFDGSHREATRMRRAYRYGY